MTEYSGRNAELDLVLTEAHARYVEANPASRVLHETAARSLPGGNTRTVLFFDPYPLTFVRGAGQFLKDADGHEYLDFLGEYTAGLFGHSHPTIRTALDTALDGGISLGGHNRMEAEFSALVVERFPSIDLVRFTNSGTEANLMALSTARAVTGRNQIMVIDGGYHGGVLYFAGGGSPINVPFDFLLAPYNNTAATLELMTRAGDDLAAVILEPMLGSGGCIPADPDYLRALRQATRDNGSLLIFDEVMTSRLAPGGLQERVDVMPDLTTLGKYIGGGMSFGAFGGRAELMARFDPRRPDAFPHAGTFNNNVLTMTAGCAVLRDIYTPQVAEDFNRRGDALRQRLNAVVEAQGVNLQFTGLGSMMTLHPHRHPVRCPADAKLGAPGLIELFFFDLLEAGIYMARRGMINLSLPHTNSDCDQLVEAVEEFCINRRSLLLDDAPSA